MELDSNQAVLRPISSTVAAAPRERSTLANASFRVYYSLRAGAVPFLWESAPGTPKNGPGATAAVAPAETAAAAEQLLLPPLSPPPSYQSSQMKAARCRSSRSASWPAAAARGVLRALRGVLGLRKRRRQSPGLPASYL
ncbi:hypothetical protein QOZ80_3BG0256040 [Eleusine coracana subsp. coracana]|nr:hypothetical protein QOZ80_3BG0256040 [Eleusine coracana subsp. coracana]